MSYILEALQRADAERERERGDVPNLHVRQIATLGASAKPDPRSRLWMVFVIIGALCGMAAVLWIWWTPSNAVRVDSAALASSAPNPWPPASGLPLGAAASVTAIAPQTIEGISPITQRTEPPVGDPKKAIVTLPPLKIQPRLKSVAKAEQPAPVPLLSELPEEIRRQIPKLTINGSVYSNRADQRLLLINNQVLNQGGAVAPELTLEEIGSGGSVFSYRGTRFRVTH